MNRLDHRSEEGQEVVPEVEEEQDHARDQELDEGNRILHPLRPLLPGHLDLHILPPTFLGVAEVAVEAL